MKKGLKAAVDFISTFITAAVIIIAAALVAVNLLGWNLFSVDSGSMTPAYPVNTLVVVRDIDPEEIQTGDVITYVLNEDGVLVTHRVAAIDSQNQTFTTKGDANFTADAAPVLWGNVIGKVVFGIPWVGKPMRVLTDPANRTIVIAVIVAIFLASLIWDIAAGKRRKKGKKE